MAIIEIILLLVTLVVISNVLSHYIVAIPGSLIQITLGIVIALLFKIKIEVTTDWFMLLFIAPILFFDGSRFPKKELWAMKKPIIANSIFLVILSTILVGMIIHWLVPNMPLATSFALAGILAPTDPIAVQSISKKAKLPSNLMHLVSGESLINDASGLICFKYGVAATVSGYFSLKDASIEFFYIAIVGAIIGLILMWLIDVLELFIYQQGIDDITLHTILRVVTPFLIYFIAEELFHASGVVAVVVAGVLKVGTNNKKFSVYSSELQVVVTKTWDLVVYLLNGVVFIILGIELPQAMRSIVISDHSTMLAIGYAVVVWLSILAVRTLWSYVYDLFSRKTRASFQKAILSGLSGVRGAVTMIGVLSIPLVIDSGEPFPRRTMVLFIASGVIILSLLAATILIPLIANNTTPLHYRGSALEEDENEENCDYITQEDAEIYITKVAIQYLESHRRVENQQVVLDLISEYEKQLAAYEISRQSLSTSSFVPELLKQSIVLHTVTLKAEMQTLQDLHEQKEISDEIFEYEKDKLEHILHRLNETLDYQSVSLLTLITNSWRINYRKLKRYLGLESKKHRELMHDAQDYERILAKSAIKELSKYLKETDAEYSQNVIYQVVTSYRRRIEKLKHADEKRSEDYEEQLTILRTSVLAEQRVSIQDLFEQGRLSRKTASNIRTKINYTENSMNIELEE
ncbi:sodium:proton antiporter [Companilactobacillus sp. RD055328]|uniref:cation:proton antiporter n=1 Tax=Companilactobacillus sp. RD055328 TaxID=2916634 RepID=UPI001FC816B9|nr:sodium:proton antiporter [Companilactobacillus sp. RD055328]GKQ43005.1 sodium:proton antiporter [Companilactobacillus sp. RD055328]